MPRTPASPKKNGSKKDDQVAIIVRAPRDLVEAFDKALELGYFDAKSRNEAIVKVMKSALLDIYFVMRAFEKARELAKSEEYQNSTLPREFLYMQLALDILVNTKEAESVNQRFASFVALTASKLNANEEEMKNLADALGKLFEDSNQEVEKK